MMTATATIPDECVLLCKHLASHKPYVQLAKLPPNLRTPEVLGASVSLGLVQFGRPQHHLERKRDGGPMEPVLQRDINQRREDEAAELEKRKRVEVKEVIDWSPPLADRNLAAPIEDLLAEESRADPRLRILVRLTNNGNRAVLTAGK